MVHSALALCKRSTQSTATNQGVTRYNANNGVLTKQRIHMQTLRLGKENFSPSKIICIGRNYAAHAAELGNAIPDEMVVFLKPNSSIGNTLASSFDGETLHFEAEICFLLRAGKISAVAVGLDLTRRETQNRLKDKGLPWERCKAFNGAAIFSEFVPFSGDVASLHLELDINGEAAQRGGVPMMLFPPAHMLQELPTFLTLEDGDVVMTGTPEGVGPVAAGDVFEARLFSGDELLSSERWQAQ